jgi:hypothetical protein
VPEDAQHEMVGPYPVAAGAHRLFPRVPDDQVQLILNPHFHIQEYVEKIDVWLHKIKKNQIKMLNLRVYKRVISQSED